MGQDTQVTVKARGPLVFDIASVYMVKKKTTIISESILNLLRIHEKKGWGVIDLFMRVHDHLYTITWVLF
jgi:hypothetical protein